MASKILKRNRSNTIKMIILGIETSCDETAAAVVKNGKEILSNIVASSQDLHIKTGGIIPEQAARQQIKSIIPVIQEALKQAKLTPDKIDAIAVTVGPGLIGSLLVGVETAKTLSALWNKPIIPVNHLIGHIYASFLSTKISPKFPAIALIASGGHTDLVQIKGHGNIEWIGGTRDDAAGECFDKTARIIGLPYPGGPAISKKAEKVNKSNLNKYPRPLINKKNYEFSFSGLKTSVLRSVENKKLTKKEVQKESAEIQEAIVDCLVHKTLKAAMKYKPKSIIISGGVAANSRLREKIKSDTKVFIPKPKFCTDNAAMIASAAYYNPKKTLWNKVSANPQLSLLYNSANG